MKKKKTLKIIKDLLLLFLLLIAPILLYNYFIKGTNNFVKLAVIGEEHHVIPDFSFVNQYNDTITNDYYQDKIYIANFFFTSCPTICPTMIYNMKYMQEELSIFPDIEFISHTVDPLNDTPDRLLDYVRSMRIKDDNWNFVTGSKDSIYKIAPYYLASASEDEIAPGGFLHSQNIVIIDKEGRVRSGYKNFVCEECGDVSKNSKLECPTTGKINTYRGNVLGGYDGLKEHVIKDMIKDVKTLLAEYHEEKTVERHAK